MINWVCSDYFELLNEHGTILGIVRLSPGTKDAFIYVGNASARITVEQLGQLAEAMTKLYEERE